MDEKVEFILDKYDRDKGFLVSILQDIQSEYYYLPKEVLVEISHALEVPVSQIYSVATFFKAFSLKPRGRHLISVCMGTACHVRGAVRIVEELERKLETPRGETTKDGKFTLETVRCVGACALGPVATIDGEYFGQMQTGKLDSLLSEYS
ncbi:MAG: NAD(P)H-dependent oxidoreductase subunit E [Thermodesulfobacteriota bacterium]|nr:NAD(P)H-dependent oxidoreductase subunit E [Thermodesulfobacteriota bacterium]